MWHFGSKCERIRAIIKVNLKRLKAVLVLRVKKSGQTFLAANFNKFLLFDVLLDLDKFWPFDNFFT